jgi:Na+/phosphate symporter
MVKDMIFSTGGGLGLFLFGMGATSDGVYKVAGQKKKLNRLVLLCIHRRKQWEF